MEINNFYEKFFEIGKKYSLNQIDKNNDGIMAKDEILSLIEQDEEVNAELKLSEIDKLSNKNTYISYELSDYSNAEWIRRDNYDGVNSTRLYQAVKRASSAEEKGEIVLQAMDYCINHKQVKNDNQIDIWNALLSVFSNLPDSGFAGFTTEQYEKFQELYSKMDDRNKDRLNPEKSSTKITQIMWNSLNTLNGCTSAGEVNEKLKNGETVVTPIYCNTEKYNPKTISDDGTIIHHLDPGSKYDNDFVTVKIVNGEKIYSAGGYYGEMNLNEEQIEILSKYLLNEDGSFKNVNNDYFGYLYRNYPDFREALGIVQGDEAFDLTGYDYNYRSQYTYAFKNEQGEISILKSGNMCHANFKISYQIFENIITAKNWLDNLNK